MTIMDPKAAAEEIAADWKKAPPAPDADDRHHLNFVEAVCKNLGVEPNGHNIAHVVRLLSQHGIEPHIVDDYPKALNEKDKLGRLVPVRYPEGHALAGQDVVFASAEEEEEYLSGGKPAEKGPVNPVEDDDD